MAVLYITSDLPSAGKTALASALAAHFSQAGKRVGYFKPFSTSPEEDADVEFIRRNVLSGSGDAVLPMPQTMPPGLGEADSLPAETARGVEQSLEKLASANELVLVEAPSISTPEGDHSPIATALVDLLDPRVVLIVRYRPGLDVEQVMQACEPFGERLLGVLINLVTLYRKREVQLDLAPAVESRGIRWLGAVPEDRLMLSITVEQIAHHLDGQWVVGQDKAQALVENILIGGNIMDKGSIYFGRMENKAVVVRGDRPDIQLAALSTPTTCLVLTGGHQPIQYVYYRAQEQGVPLLVVESDTISTAHALDTVVERSAFHHPEKHERFQELTSQHADIEAIQSGL